MSQGELDGDPVARGSRRPPSGDHRERVLEAARMCFKRNGVLSTRMDEIADEAGLQRPNLYRYFPSRDALVGAVIVREIEITNARRRDEIALAGTVGPILIQSLTLGNELARSDDLTELLLVADMRDTTSEIATSEQLVMRAEADYWTPVLGHGRARGEINRAMTDVRIIRWFLTAQVLVSTRAETLHELADDLHAFFAEFVVPPVLSKAGLQALSELDQSE